MDRGDQGLSQLNNNYKYYKSFSFDAITGYSDGSPVSITQDQQQLYVGVNQEVLVFDMKTEWFKSDELKISHAGFHRFVKSGDHFYQPNPTGLYIYNNNFDLIRTILEKHADGRAVNVYDAMEDGDGNIWLITSRYGIRKYGTDGGINAYLEDSTKMIHSVGDIIGSITESEKGIIYAGGKELFFKPKSDLAFKSVSILPGKVENEIRTLKMNDDILWIGSRNGLYSYSESTGEIKNYPLPGEANQVIEEMDMDNEGNIWMVTPSGQVKYNPAENSTMVFNDKNRWPRSFSTILRMEDGRIVAGSAGRILIINPQM